MMITPEGRTQLVKYVCGFLNKNNLDYLIYGSLGYQLLTGDRDLSIRDIDIIVKQSDFPRLVEALPSLSFNPIQTPFTIHANSLIFKGEDGKPFDISFDSYEHYFISHNIDLSNYTEVNVEGTLIKVMRVVDLIKIYEVGIEGNNQDKIKEYKKKIKNLQEIQDLKLD